MNVSPDTLRKETVALIKQIDEQIAEVHRMAELGGINPTRMRDAQGNLFMTPLLHAKATAYNTLVLLQVK